MEKRGIKLKAYAKVNLSLNILGVLSEMHVLDMVLTSVNLADVISVCVAEGPRHEITFKPGPGIIFPEGFAASGNTTAHKAVRLLEPYLGGSALKIEIEKNIPFSAGLGGSGASAAGIITAADDLFALKKKGADLKDAALKVGSDVPYQLEGGFARVKGVGEKINFFKSRCGFDLVVCKGENGVDTGMAYKKFDRLYPQKRLILCDNDSLIACLKAGDNKKAVSFMENALEKGSRLLEPRIGFSINALTGAGAEKVFMTGSGSAAVGIFENASSAFNAANALKEKGFTAFNLRTLNSGIEILHRTE